MATVEGTRARLEGNELGIKEDQEAEREKANEGKRDITEEQETTEKSAQELVQERHMHPDAFKD